jgi:hypothetical protein
MNKLLLEVSMLPQCVQDIIGMYNVEHRKQMILVCQELEVKCAFCNDYVNKKSRLAFSEYIYLYYCELTYCNTNCARCHNQLNYEWINE